VLHLRHHRGAHVLHRHCVIASVGTMRRVIRENSLSIVFGLLFLGALVGQAFAGLAEFNSQQRASGLPTSSLLEYVISPDYAVDVTENWQSEYLQFLLYVLLTVWLIQRGSPESKPMGSEGRQTDEEQRLGKYVRASSPRWASARGLRTRFYSHSLGLVMGTIFVGSWTAQSIAGWAAYNEERIGQLQDPLSWTDYVLAADFWSRSLQNWQSEFLAMGSMVTLSIYLRERGSPESKPVGASHDSTGVDG
jgi:hypothetical protein